MFLPGFLLLTVLGGITIGMGKVVTTLFALELGATPFQIGIISAAESLGMMLVTVPAGFVIARFGARRVYCLASMGPMLLSTLLPWATIWWLLAAGRGLIGLCIPFRIVSMNSSFLEQLKSIGNGKAGWYRASNSLGIAMLGPALAHALISGHGFGPAYLTIGAGFFGLALFSRVLLQDVAPTHRTSHVEEAGFVAQIRQMLADRQIAGSCLIEFLSSSTSSLHGTFIIVVALTALQLSQAVAVQLVMIHGVASVTALFCLGAPVQYLPRPVAYTLSFALACSGLMLLGTGAQFSTLAAGGICLATGSALIHMVNMAQMSRHPVAKSKISGLYSLAQMSGNFSGALLGGLLSHLVSAQHIFLAWLPVVLLGSALLCLRARRDAGGPPAATAAAGPPPR